MADSDTPFQKFVRDQLKLIKRSGRGASLDGGLAPDFIRDILNGNKQSINGTNLAKLAKALQVPVEIVQINLLHTEGLSNEPSGDLQTVNFRRIVPLLSALRRGAWLSGRGSEMLDEKKAVTSRDERYADLEQSARTIDDDSVDMFYPKGAIVIYAPADRVGVRVGSLLVVRRLRMNGEVEIAIWQAGLNAGKLTLNTACKRLAEQETASASPGGDIVLVEIQGVVVSAMLDAPGLQGPMIASGEI